MSNEHSPAVQEAANTVANSSVAKAAIQQARSYTRHVIEKLDEAAENSQGELREDLARMRKTFALWMEEQGVLEKMAEVRFEAATVVLDKAIREERA